MLNIHSSKNITRVSSNFELTSRISQRLPPIKTEYILTAISWVAKRLLNRQQADLEYTDVIVNPLLLVLRYALSDPSNVSNFLAIVSMIPNELAGHDIPALATSPKHRR
jgi:hypothetical protein